MKATLLGIHEHTNGSTGEKFWGLSFRISPKETGSMAINDQGTMETYQQIMAEARAAGGSPVFEIEGATAVVDTVIDPETERPVPRRGAKGDLCHTIRQTDPLAPITVQELGVARTTPVLTRKVNPVQTSAAPQS